MCSITLEVMTDPVSTADGHVYERSAIEDWLKCAALLSHIYMCAMLIHFCVVMINVLRTHDTSPLTNEVLREKTLVAVSTLAPTSS